MDGFQNNYDVWEKPDKMSTYSMIPLEWNFRKCKQHVYRDRKQNSDFLERIKRWEGGENYKGSQEVLECDERVHYPACGDSFTGVYMCQNLPRCTL